MVVDLKRFQPKQQLAPGLLWVVEQVNVCAWVVIVRQISVDAEQSSSKHCTEGQGALVMLLIYHIIYRIIPIMILYIILCRVVRSMTQQGSKAEGCACYGDYGKIVGFAIHVYEYTVYIRYFQQRDHHTYGHLRCAYTRIRFWPTL